MEKEKENTEEEFCIKQYKENKNYFNHLLSIQNIGKAVKEARIKRGFTKVELAKYLEIPTSTLHRLENSNVETRLSTILKILERLDAKIFFQIELQSHFIPFNAQKKREYKQKHKK